MIVEQEKPQHNYRMLMLGLGVGVLLGVGAGYYHGKETGKGMASEAKPQFASKRSVKDNSVKKENKIESPVKVFKPVPLEKPKVRLSGMTAFRGKKKALLEISVPGSGTEPLGHSLEESESADGVKVMSIDPVKGEVRLDIKGEESTRSFDEVNETSWAKGLD